MFAHAKSEGSKCKQNAMFAHAKSEGSKCSKRNKMLCLLMPRVKVASVANSMCFIVHTVFIGLAKRAHLVILSALLYCPYLIISILMRDNFEKTFNIFLVVSLQLQLC